MGRGGLPVLRWSIPEVGVVGHGKTQILQYFTLKLLKLEHSTN